MTIFDFSNEYLKAQTAEFLPYFDLAQLDIYRKPHVFSWPPYFCAEEGNVQQRDIMKMFALILQNRFNLPNVVNFLGNYDDIRTVTNDFDIYYLARLTPEALMADFARKIGFSLPSRSWVEYSEGIIDAAKYIVDMPFCYYSYMQRVETEPDAVIAELCKIRGIGPALARNFLKEIGALEFGKPDVHLIEVFKAFDNSVVDEKTFDESLKKQSLKAGIYPYEFDRVIWLICTGDYFKHGKKIKSSHKKLRESFIDALKVAIASGEVEV